MEEDYYIHIIYIYRIDKGKNSLNESPTKR